MIGREKERNSLLKTLDSDESEFVAVYGRRRVGKTYLVREAFGNRFVFEHTGLAHTDMRGQLRAFKDSMARNGLARKRHSFRSWYEAFLALSDELSRLPDGKKVVFLDELPWLDTQGSRLIGALEHFWNGWAAARKDVVLVVCGSATSWIVERLLRAKGGLYNRVTRSVPLRPFTLAECERYAVSRGIALERPELAEAYMVFGGIPFYWRQLEPGASLAQNLDRLFFAPDAPLRGEFGQLYDSLFRKAEDHVRIVRALATKKAGMTRDEILRATGIAGNGRFSRELEQLEQCGFVRRYVAFGKRRKEALWQLVDGFTLFHFRFLEGDPNPDARFWSASVASPALSAWRGLAFERLCLLHLPQIKAALGIAGVLTKTCSWRHVPDAVHPDGAQVDLLIDRDDRIVDLCEMKWTHGAYALDKEEAEKLRDRCEIFRAVTGTDKAVHVVLATPFGLRPNLHSGLVQNVVTLADLFRDA